MEKDEGIGSLDELGVCRYDGQNFVHYSTIEGLSGNEVWALFKDSRNYLWIGTDGGLSRFHPAQDGKQAYFTNYTVENGLSANVIRAIVEDQNGHLWLNRAQLLVYLRLRGITPPKYINYQ